MSTYTQKLKHPVTGKLTNCLCMDDYFGAREYGYRFEGETTVYTQEELDAMTPNEE